MRLSKLQQYILEKCYNAKSAVPAEFRDFYKKLTDKNIKIVRDVIHKSLESLTDKDLVAAFGKKTAKKWFIHKIKLTGAGKKITLKIIKSKQRKLPIK